jgi:hypothetical protein
MPEEIKAPEVVKIEETAEVNVQPGSLEAIAVEKTNEEAAAVMTKMLQDSESITLAEAVIQNNELVFSHKDKTYRVRKPSYLEKDEANKYRMKRYIVLLKDPDSLLERDLRKLYKNKGIDIEALEKEMSELYTQQQNLMLELGKGIKESRPQTELLKYKEEILSIMASVQGLANEKQTLLEYSLENRLLMDVYGYMIYLITEVKAGEKWQKLWNSYDDCLATSDAELLRLVTKHGAAIVTDEMSRNLLK